MRRKGFTLIELLVVIAIIGLLSSVVLASLSTARSRARDATRASDIHQIQVALELYYTANGYYPPSGGASSPNSGWTNSNDSSWTTFKNTIAPYMATVPNDPQQSTSGWAGTTATYTYAYYSMGYGCSQQWYMIVYRPEGGTPTSPGVRTCDNNFFNYTGTVTSGASR